MGLKPMIIITAAWDKQRTFKMIPLTKDCIYNECIFDKKNKVLAIVSKEYKKNFHTIPDINSHGDEMNTKSRVVLDTYYEYYIEDKKEIISFIESMADNSEIYNYKELIEETFLD